jgi:DNA-binding winged helix-turn-helix (wHTH) protein
MVPTVVRVQTTFSGNGAVSSKSISTVDDAGTTRLALLLRSLQWAAARLARPLTVKEIAEVAIRGAMTAVDARAAVVALMAEGGGELRRVHDVGLNDDARRRLSFIERDEPGVIARMAFARKPTFLRSLAEALARSPVRSVPTILGGGALVSLPLTYAERRLGVIVLGWPLDRDFPADERASLTVLADQCSLALGQTLALREPSPGATWQLGDLEIDPAGNRVVIAGRPVHLTPSEFHMLVLLAEEPGKCRSRKELLSHLWHTEHVGDERACDAHLANLRKKIERDPSRPERLVTVRGLGYALQVQPVAVG